MHCYPSRVGNCHNILASPSISDFPDANQDDVFGNSCSIQASFSLLTYPLPLARCLSPTFLPLLLCPFIYSFLHNPHCRSCQTTPLLHIFPKTLMADLVLFGWGDVDEFTFSSQICSWYEEVVHWRRNLCKIPSGKAGLSFVKELTHLLQA